MNLRLSLAACLMSCLVGVQDPSPTRELGREQCKLFYAGELDTLWERLSPPLKALFGDTLDGFAQFQATMQELLGDETKILDESVQDTASSGTYLRRAEFEKSDGSIDVLWQFDTEGTVIAFRISPSKKEAESRFLDYRTKTPLRLPFEGAWDVFWGGRTLDQNYHTAYGDQRFAYDLLIMEDGVSHTGDGARNEDYFCYGKRLVAPGAGKVVAAENGVADNLPGAQNPRQALGNHVILDHGQGEFSFMAHFQKGSVQVKVGDRVAAGDFLGLVGNSGNTTEPHLHYHLQTTSVFNQGEGLPSQFLNYTADGKLVERGEPVKGQVIQAR